MRSDLSPVADARHLIRLSASHNRVSNANLPNVLNLRVRLCATGASNAATDAPHTHTAPVPARGRCSTWRTTCSQAWRASPSTAGCGSWTSRTTASGASRASRHAAPWRSCRSATTASAALRASTGSPCCTPSTWYARVTDGRASWVHLGLASSCGACAFPLPPGFCPVIFSPVLFHACPSRTTALPSCQTCRRSGPCGSWTSHTTRFGPGIEKKGQSSRSTPHLNRVLPPRILSTPPPLFCTLSPRRLRTSRPCGIYRTSLRSTWRTTPSTALSRSPFCGSLSTFASSISWPIPSR